MQMRAQRALALLLACAALALIAVVQRAPRPATPGIKTVQRRVKRIRNVAQYLDMRTRMRTAQQVAPVEWVDVEMDAPDTTDRLTLRMLARMATIAYYPNVTSMPDSPGWRHSWSFGWEDNGIRGHVFADEKNKHIIVALKGTSASLLPGGGDTAKRDKDNDNLFFSCCCARVTSSWTPVCGCYDDARRKCDSSCVSRALIERSLYYPAATDLYNNISYMYPESQVWMTGHSLGGALASLLGITFAVPTVTFEAPGERLAASRLHLPLPPPETRDEDAFALAPVTHVYNTADPLATGACQGPSSPCSVAGYAMESRCHAGRSVIYDTVKYLGWTPGVLHHRITTVLDELLAEDWNTRVRRAGRTPPSEEAVPPPARESACHGMYYLRQGRMC